MAVHVAGILDVAVALWDCLFRSFLSSEYNTSQDYPERVRMRKKVEA